MKIENGGSDGVFFQVFVNTNPWEWKIRNQTTSATVTITPCSRLRGHRKPQLPFWKSGRESFNLPAKISAGYRGGVTFGAAAGEVAHCNVQKNFAAGSFDGD